VGKVFDAIDEDLQNWIEQQKIFFVATAPLDSEGLINCSPKGLDSFRILGPKKVAYLDWHGSGIETVAHIRENTRIVVLFCAFEGPPKILRLNGVGKVHQLGSDSFNELSTHFPESVGARSIIEIELTRIADSCGYAVPKYTYEGDRDTLVKYCENKGPAGLAKSRQGNRRSLDGLPGWDDSV